MNHSLKIGFSFGLTSGIVTTLGLMVGLHAGTHSKLAVTGGILIIAIADAFSDALGIHLSEEAETEHVTKEIWQSTISTFLSKLVFTLIFIVPVLLFKLSTAIVLNIIWGLFLLGFFSFMIAKRQKANPWKVVLEHLVVALAVIIVTHCLGDWLSSMFG